MNKVTLYTIGCPKCVVLEKKLKLAGIDFDTITDIEAIQKTGYTAVPILEADGRFMEFTEAVKWVNEHSKK